MKNIAPKIGIPVPTSIDAAYNLRSWPAYAHAIQRSGGEAVQIDISLSPEELKHVTAKCDGFVLPGSPADVDPSHYDAPRIEACGPADLVRERYDFLVLEHARQAGKPLLGICYGCQSMNTYFGGALVQDLSPLPVNHEAGSKVAVAHTALIARDSRLGSILLGDAAAAAEATKEDSRTPAGFLRLPVNTSHHQAVATTGGSMRVSARCPDDEVVEAIEPDGMFHVEQSKMLLGVQWHPERSFEISAASRALFARLVHDARKVQSCA